MTSNISPHRSMKCGPGCWWKSGKWWVAGSSPRERLPNRQSRMRKSGIVRIARRKSRRRRSSIPRFTSGGPCVTNASEKTENNFYGDKSTLPLRGGCWLDESRAGVFALNFNDPRVNSWNNVGFRAASPPQPDAWSLRALRQCRGLKGFAPLPKDKLGTARRFLCAAATGSMVPGPACSRSI